MSHRYRILLAVFISLMGLTGCQITTAPQTASTPIPYFVDNFRISYSAHFQQNPPQKVVLLCTDSAQIHGDVTQQVAQALSSEFRAQLFCQVVVPRQLTCRTSMDEILSGSFSEPELLEIAKRYGADSVLLYRINDYSPYGAMKISLSVGLIDAREMILSFAADGIWDLNDPTTSKNYDAYLKTAGHRQNRATWKLLRQSPRHLVRYIGAQVVKAMVLTYEQSESSEGAG